MAEAGVLLEEINLKKIAQKQREQSVALFDESAREAAMAELPQIEMRQAIAAEARRKFLKN